MTASETLVFMAERFGLSGFADDIASAALEAPLVEMAPIREALAADSIAWLVVGWQCGALDSQVAAEWFHAHPESEPAVWAAIQQASDLGDAFVNAMASEGNESTGLLRIMSAGQNASQYELPTPAEFFSAHADDVEFLADAAVVKFLGMLFLSDERTWRLSVKSATDELSKTGKVTPSNAWLFDGLIRYSDHVTSWQETVGDFFVALTAWRASPDAASADRLSVAFSVTDDAIAGLGLAESAVAHLPERCWRCNESSWLVLATEGTIFQSLIDTYLSEAAPEDGLAFDL